MKRRASKRAYNYFDEGLINRFNFYYCSSF